MGRGRFLAMMVMVAFLLALGCTAGPGTGGWVEERTVDGLVTTVRTVSGSVWGGRAHLVEDASIGSDGETEASDAYILGGVSGLAVGEDRIYVLDRQVPIIRTYDFSGRHVVDIGREGSGPGEYRQPESIVVHPEDGRLFVRTPQNARVNVYSRDGEILGHWPIKTGFNTSNPMVMTTDGRLWTYIITNLGSADVTEWKRGMRLCGPEGTASDTIHAPVFDFEPWNIVGRHEDNTTVNQVPFSPFSAWAMATDGSVIGGVSEAYRFEVRKPDDTVVVIEREYDPVRVQSEEGRWHRDAATANMVNMFPGWVWNGRDVPGVKPAFSSFIPDLAGRIWVVRPGPGERIEGGVEDPYEDQGWWSNPLWRDTVLVDVFDLEGRFLGEVDLPDGIRFYPRPVIDGNLVIAYMEDDDGLPSVKRYRLVVPGDQQ